ncbi:hypothetical protein C2G38_2245894 [Gigaspora rosea]|uniref:Poly(A) RNA polymerase mitochondrial-like central palm domain-containing protein n=1 Tax=Gigaspora rosea TaxID=44941 RepID=A0A397V6Q2_9GLOM|nr:hypothetical protein C2G38_2245894 [Gigaspora rosea]
MARDLARTSTSDVDICVMTPSKELEDILTLSEKLQKYEMKVVKCVPKAKVPIVKFWDPTLKLACDINVNNAQALYNTNLIKSYVCLDSRVRPLVMIIKHWAQRRDLNDAACGTLSSYTWTCMTLNFLQMHYPPILPVLKINEKENENELLEVKYKNNESIEEPFNPERNLGNGLCCEINDEYEYDEFEYVAGIPFITLKALHKANLDSKKNELEKFVGQT